MGLLLEQLLLEHPQTTVMVKRHGTASDGRMNQILMYPPLTGPEAYRTPVS